MPLLLIRAGLAKNLEFRFSWNGLFWTENNGHFKPEASDMSVELKAQLMEQTRFLPAIGLLGSVSVPTGNGASRSNSQARDRVARQVSSSTHAPQPALSWDQHMIVELRSPEHGIRGYPLCNNAQLRFYHSGPLFPVATFEIGLKSN
jgi:hypothetical protein